MKLTAKSGHHTLGIFNLAEGKDLMLGASAKADCSVAGESYLSRLHAVLTVRGDQLHVERLPDARNPVFFRGSPANRFEMKAGDFFVIGSTVFQAVSDATSSGEAADGSRGGDPSRSEPESAPSYQFTLGADELRPRVGTDRRDRLRLLDLMELPEVLRTKSRAEFYVYACGLLRLETGAKWVRVLTVDNDQFKILAEDAIIDRESEKPLSRSLINGAIEEAPKPVTFCWSHKLEKSLQATAHEGVDWAISCAMKIPDEPHVVIYLAGASESAGGYLGFDTQSGARTFLRDTARLVGLVADMIGRAMSLQKVEGYQSSLNRFFSGRLVRRILDSEGTDELKPKIAEATIMFFDIRGFSKKTEESLERLLEYAGDLRQTLTDMTQCVFDRDGVVLRYIGDAILACWNVPDSLPNHVESGCLAALDMVDTMKKATAGWTCGIGLAVGDVVAGRLGSEQIYAYDILGAVANQASRVEGITKKVKVPILITEEIAKRLTSPEILTRRVARFRPAGMEHVLTLCTIERVSQDVAVRQQTDANRRTYAEGLALFEEGKWTEARTMLYPIEQADPPAEFLRNQATRNDGKPPRGWDGIIDLDSK